MDKLDCIEEYFSSISAYYLYLFGKIFRMDEYKGVILNKNYLNGAKVAFVSNLMLGIKEELVDNMGNMEYQSKIFIKSLENSVDIIATKVESGYKIGNYIFADAPTLIAILRNKLAHGKYRIDFLHNRVIFEHKGVDIVLNIEKLVCFVIFAFRNKLFNSKNKEYERNIFYYIKQKPNRTEKIKDLNEARGIIKNCYYMSIKLESLNGLPIFNDCIKYINGFIKLLKNDVNSAMKSDYYRNMINFFKSNGYKFTIEYKNLNDKKDISNILKVVEIDILNNENLNYEQQVGLIGYEVQKALDERYKNINAITANISNIIMLDAINGINSVDDDDLMSYIGNIYSDGIKIGYDEFGMTMLAMFNSLFIYPFDDVYSVSGEYNLIRNNEMDFSTLDLSLVNPSIIKIDDSPLVNAKTRLDSLNNKINEITNKLNQQKNNLSRVKNNANAVSKINQNIIDLNNSLSSLMISYAAVDSEYNDIVNDFTVNSKHFYNKAIIEGIRNSIAHGHYEITIKGDLWDTEMVFKDIYEGKVTFQVMMTYGEFSQLIENNCDTVLNFIKSKNNMVKKR